MLKILKKDGWKKLLVSGSTKNGFTIEPDVWDDLLDSFDEWSGKIIYDRGTKGKGTEHLGNDSGRLDGTGWEPYMSMRIDIRTNFNETWYQNKFKSGFLNKAIMAIKTDIMSRVATNAQGASKGAGGDQMAGHKYVKDEMLDHERRKLDNIQWKMTNKVAKDFISMLLGWSRKKELIQNGTDVRPAQEKLTKDEGFGQEMADKALDNRGILGRLKQKIFGGQSNNVISVAFQMADYNDGWTVVSPSVVPEGKQETPIAEVFESTKDPFEGELFLEDDGNMDSRRHDILMDVCIGKPDSVDILIEDCLIEQV